MADEAALPLGAATGTCRWATAEEALYCYTGSAWVAAGGSGGASSFAELTGQLGDLQTGDGAIDGGTGGEIADASITAADLAPDSVGASELDDSAVEPGLEAVLDLPDLQGSLTLAGDVDGAHGSNDLDEAAVETELEAVLDLADLQGAVTDAQVPNDLTVDLAALATTATTANAGDSATAFFSTGTLEDARLSANVSLLGQTISASEVAADVATQAELDAMAPLAGATFTGPVSLDNAQAFQLFEADAQGSHSFTLTAPASLTGDTTCTIAADGKIPDSCVGDGTDGGGSPGGSDLQVQYNDGGAFGGDAGFVFNKATDRLTLGASHELTLPIDTGGATPTLNFGDGDTGLYELADDTIGMGIGGFGAQFQWRSNFFEGVNSNGPMLMNGGPTATSPSVAPNKADSTTGLGLNGGGDGRLVASSVSRLGYSGVANAEGISHLNGNFTADSDARYRSLTARRITTNATPAELFLNGSSTRMALANDTTWTFACTVTARRTDADNESAGYKLEGVIDRQTNAASTALVGSVTQTVLAEDTGAWDATAAADATNGALVITVTGEASKTIRWVGTCQTIETTG